MKCSMIVDMVLTTSMSVYDGEFVERAHQEGVKMEKHSANVKDAQMKSHLHSKWE